MTNYYVKINGSTVSDVRDCTLKRSWKGETGTGNLIVAYGDGSFYDSLAYGQEVEIKRTSDDLKVWGGIVNEVNRNIDKRITLSIILGEYIELIKKILVDETYRGQTITAMVNDLCSKYLPTGFTYANVTTTTKTLEYIQFKRNPLYDCLRDLAKYLDWTIFIDVNKDLNFVESGVNFSGVTLTQGSNLRYISEKQDVARLVNKVRVVGGFREYTNIELFSGDGSNLTFTLQRKPISTQVEVYEGAVWVIKKGYAKDSTSSYDYDTDAEAFQIIFATGKAPANAVDNVRITYVYGVPIMVEGESSASQTTYSVLSEVDFTDNTILQRSEAVDLVQQALQKYQNPLYVYDCIVRNIEPTADIGETVHIVSTRNNIDTYNVVIAVEYHIIGRSLGTKISVTETKENFLELMRGILLDLNDIKSDKKNATEIVTKLLNFMDYCSIKDDTTDYLRIYKRSIAGESLIWGSPSYGIWGVGKWGLRTSRVYGTNNAKYGLPYGSASGSYVRVV